MPGLSRIGRYKIGDSGFNGTDGCNCRPIFRLGPLAKIAYSPVDTIQGSRTAWSMKKIVSGLGYGYVPDHPGKTGGIPSVGIWGDQGIVAAMKHQYRKGIRLHGVSYPVDI